ncbi:MAG: hypothetical protein II264_03845 [Ruminococcus sp.]|nr:hypothetical protein [Ruminococcus sp.]
MSVFVGNELDCRMIPPSAINRSGSGTMLNTDGTKRGTLKRNPANAHIISRDCFGTPLSKSRKIITPSMTKPPE